MKFILTVFLGILSIIANAQIETATPISTVSGTEKIYTLSSDATGNRKSVTVDVLKQYMSSLTKDRIPFGSSQNTETSSSSFLFKNNGILLNIDTDSSGVINMQATSAALGVKPGINYLPYSRHYYNSVFPGHPNLEHFRYRVAALDGAGNSNPHADFSFVSSFGKNDNLPDTSGNMIHNFGYNIEQPVTTSLALYLSFEQRYTFGTGKQNGEWHVECKDTTGRVFRPISILAPYDGEDLSLSFTTDVMAVYRGNTVGTNYFVSGQVPWIQDNYKTGLRDNYGNYHLLIRGNTLNNIITKFSKKYYSGAYYQRNILTMDDDDIVAVGDSAGVKVKNQLIFQRENATRPTIKSLDGYLRYEATRLDVYSTDANDRFLNMVNLGEDKRFSFCYDKNNIFFLESQSANRPVIIDTRAPTYSLAVGQGGHVGINLGGNANPYHSLEVGGDASIYGYVRLDATSAVDGSGALTGSLFKGVGGQLYYKSDGGVVSQLSPPSSGTVSSVSVATANGVSGSVTNATTTPEITLTLGAITPSSVNSVVLSGSTTPTLAVTGTSTISGSNTGDNATNSQYSPLLASQTANKFYVSPNGSSGVPTFRAIVAADVPTLNQNTTGTAASWTTGRTLALTGDVTYTSPSFTGAGNVTAAATVTRINGIALSGLATGILKNTTTTGAPSIATAGTDYQAPISLTTVGSSGAATFVGNTLNIPTPAGGGGGGWTDGGTTMYPTTLTDAVGIGTTTPISLFTLAGTASYKSTYQYLTGNVTLTVSNAYHEFAANASNREITLGNLSASSGESRYVTLHNRDIYNYIIVRGVASIPAKHSIPPLSSRTYIWNDYQTCWLPTSSKEDVSVAMIIDGGGSAITTGIKGDIEIPADGTITSATLLCDQTGSIVVDLWKDTYANFPPVVADAITGSAKPTVSSGVKDTKSFYSSTLTGWTTAVNRGDIIRVNVDSASTLTRCTISIILAKI